MNTDPHVLEVSILCVAALCNVTLTALQKVHNISHLTPSYPKRKLFLKREVLVPQQLSVSISYKQNQNNPTLGNEMEVVKEPKPQMDLAYWFPSGHHSVTMKALMRNSFPTVSFGFCLRA